MIKIIGTNHLMDEKEVEELIKKENPDIIGIELCEARVNAIITSCLGSDEEEKSLLGKITSKIKQKAEEEGMTYGSDMKAALSYALENKLDYVPVDMPILKIQDLFSKIPIKEQEGFQKELLEFEKESVKKKVKEEEVLTEMKSRYPTAFEFLINMRNLYIANQILKSERDNPGKRIVIILGASHVGSVTKLIGGKDE